MKKNHKKEYQPGRIGSLVHFMSEKYSLDERMVRADLVINFPELKDKAHCANCDRSMAIYSRSISFFDIKLLLVMFKIINERQGSMVFTEANKIHRQEVTKRSSYTIASQFTIASKLGLVAKVLKKNKEGETVHDKDAGWAITTRGFALLRNEPVPKKVTVFSNQIQEHFDETITMREILRDSCTLTEERDYLRDAQVVVEAYQHPQLLQV